ncbi:TonB-dependent receptor [Pseudoalteromonas fenneropenaei]|uniref:TonB-dependent receptor n=1 Tax=Pseudoalteromonas fenneropenaei TaxID=1737459 RepID=A0ABV7CN51_9GAMM
MRLGTTSVSLLALMVHTTLYADNTHSQSDIPPERIVVTGSRVAESMDEVPASITIITQQDIQAQMLVNPEMQSILANLVPGLAADTGSSSNSGQTLRGRNPLVMIDGVPQSTPLRNGALDVRTIDPSAIERIEVIKGATSIYGNGAAGGIINFITKKASAGSALSGEASLSSRFSAVKTAESAGVRAAGLVQGQINQFNYLVSASYEENGVQRDAEGDILGLQYGLSDAVTENVFVKVGYDFDQDKSLTVSFNQYSSQQKTDLGDVVNDINSGEKTYAIHVPVELQKQGKPQGPDGNTNFSLKYVDYALFDNTQLNIDVYQQTIENVFFYSPRLANPDLGLDGGQSIIRSEKSGLRTTFNSRFEFDGFSTTLIYGIDALEDTSSQPLVDGRMWVPEMAMKSLAGFVQSKWLFGEDLVLKAGVRQENIDLEVDDYETLKLCSSPTQCSTAVKVKGDTLDYRATTYNLGLKYNWHAYFSPFISISQGADISDLGLLLRAATVTDIADIQTEAAIIDNYELGFSSQFSTTRFELALFRSTSELGTSNKFNAQTGIYEPVRAPQEIWGGEALLSHKFTPALSMTASYSYVEGKQTDTDTYLGARQISAPKATLALKWQATDALTLNLDSIYVGDRKRFAPNSAGKYVADQAPVDSYFVTNLSGSYQFAANWQGYFAVHNLFNLDYYPAKSQSYAYGSYNVKGVGSTVNLGVKTRF